MAWYTVSDSSPVDRVVEFLSRKPRPKDERKICSTVSTDNMHELHYVGSDLYVDVDRTKAYYVPPHREVGRFKTHKAAIEAWRGMLRRGEL